MTDTTIDLDRDRGMAAQKGHRASAAADWHEAAEKARYVLNHFAGTLTSEDRRRQTRVAAVLADFDRLAGET
jgi:hypothetical protein